MKLAFQVNHSKNNHKRSIIPTQTRKTSVQTVNPNQNRRENILTIMHLISTILKMNNKTRPLVKSKSYKIGRI